MKKQKPKSTKTTASREKQYLETLDLQDWWEDFAHAVNKNGTQKYPTAWSFVKAKSKVKWQQTFLYWLLGPEEGQGKSLFPDFKQYDWQAKRERGFWFSSKNIEELKGNITRKATTFDRLQSAGETLLDDLLELGELQKQITKEFGGRLMLPNNSTAENAARATLFLSLKKQVQELKAHILQTFAKTQGMDLNQLSNFLELFAGGMGQAVALQLGYGKGTAQIEGDKEKSTYKNVLGQLVDMTLKKSADLELPLPTSSMEEVIMQETGNKKKARVQ